MDNLSSLRVHLPDATPVEQGRSSDLPNEPESKVAPGVSAGVRQAGVAAAASAGPMEILEETVGKLRRAGASKILVGERHWRPENLDVLNATLRGALRAAPDKKLTLYREVHDQNVGKEDAIEAALLNPGTKARFVGPFANVVARGHTNKQPENEKEVASAKQFSSTIGRSQVSIKLLSFANPQRTDLQRFIADTEFAVASLGYCHALHEASGADVSRVPWRGDLEPLPPGFHTAKMGAATQTAMYGGFYDAQKKAPTIFVASSGILHRDGEPPSPEERARFIGHHLHRGFAVLEIQGLFVMAPEAFLPTLRAMAAKHPGQTQLHSGV